MTDSTCCVDGCTRPLRVKSRRLCNTHRQAELRAKGKGRTHYTVTCDGCGKEFGSTRPDGKLCSDECRALAYADGLATTLPLDHPVQIFIRSARSALPADHPVRVLIRENAARKGALRQAVDDGDHIATIAAIRASSTVDSEGCWNWQRRIKRDYPTATIGKRFVQVHRLALEAALGKPLGKQAAHHICANSRCVNPDHLQPVTARENAAEMLARTYMESRIADLEAALATHAPNHPLLAEVGVVRVA